MLVAIIYTGRDVCEDKEKRSLQLFSDWQRPYGAAPGRQVGGHGGPPLERGARSPRPQIPLRHGGQIARVSGGGVRGRAGSEWRR